MKMIELRVLQRVLFLLFEKHFEISIKLFIVYLYYPINAHKVCSNAPSFISNISNLSFIFLVSLPRGLSILLILKKTAFDFIDIFYDII